jgi:hypothetical protein
MNSRLIRLNKPVLRRMIHIRTLHIKFEIFF